MDTSFLSRVDQIVLSFFCHLVRIDETTPAKNYGPCSPLCRCFLTGACLSDIELYKIRCNPMHLLCCALPVPHVRVTRGALVAHRYTYTYAPSRCRTFYFITLSLSVWNDLADPVRIRWCRTGGFQEQSQCFLTGVSCSITFYLLLFFHFSFCLCVGILGLTCLD